MIINIILNVFYFILFPIAVFTLQDSNDDSFENAVISNGFTEIDVSIKNIK